RLALTVALVAGVLLFLPRAPAYGAKTIFVWKLGLLALAIGAQTLLHTRLLRVRGQEPAAPLKGLAVLALALWFFTAAAGRAVGFV
ncbi:MAG TPA: hypothetical protein VNR18_05600, partial [Hyphomicrobiales bacterium]|nr:hypothetical protein [Hyphomicrobiales bacterium]